MTYVVNGFGAVNPWPGLQKIYGDYNNHALVFYLRNAGSYPAPRSLIGVPPVDLVNVVRQAMLANNYRGVPLDLLKIAVHSVAAANADDYVLPTDTMPDPTAVRKMATDVAYQMLIPVAEEIAAKPPVIKLNLGPVGAAIVACVKSKGLWKNNTCTTTRAGVRWDSTTNTFVSTVPAVISAPTTNIGLYIVGGIITVGVALLFLKRVS